jgi:hypothetical protein
MGKFEGAGQLVLNAITLIETDFGEEKAQAYVNTWLQQLSVAVLVGPPCNC